MMEISAASAYTIIFARNIHKVRDFLAIAKKRREKTVCTLRSTTVVMSRSRQNNFRYVVITRKLSRDNDKTTFVMSRSRENYVVITRKQDRKIIIMHGRLELP